MPAQLLTYFIYTSKEMLKIFRSAELDENQRNATKNFYLQKIQDLLKFGFNTILEAECSLLTKLRQQHMLNEKQVIFNTYLLKTKMQLKIISQSLYNVNDVYYIVNYCLALHKLGRGGLIGLGQNYPSQPTGKTATEDREKLK